MKQIQPKAKAIALPMATMPVPFGDGDNLRQYLQAIAKFPMLSPEEERELSERWAYQQDLPAAHRLVTSHLRLVAKIAGKYRGYGLPMGDLIAEGNIGLMQAVKRFDPERGFRLATYAMWWVKASIQEYILRSWSLVKIGSSAAQKRLFFNLRRIKKNIGAAHGVDLTEAQVADIARTLDVSREDVIDMDRRMIASDVYLNSPMGAEGDDEKMDFLADEAQNHEDVVLDRQEQKIYHGMLTQAMDTLNERERDIFTARRLKDEPDTLEDLSQIYNISRERVRQIEAKAFEKVQAVMLKSAEAL
jgi:RNA polymerase sigma-32 factor